MLKKDVRWDLVESGKDYDTFLKSLPEFYLAKGVPDNIRKELEIARKILEHSYFVYEFIDVGFLQIIVCLEKVLKLKYSQLVKSPKPQAGKSKKPKWITFEQLINWAASEGLLETETVKRVHMFRNIRNGKMHASTSSLGGFLYLHRTDEPICYINDLYQDTGLRKVRQALGRKLHTDIGGVVKSKGSMWQDAKNQSGANVIVDVGLIFVNNKGKLPQYSIILIFAFDLRHYESGKAHTPPYEELVFDRYEVKDDKSLWFYMNDTLLGQLRLATEIEQVLCRMWQERFDKLGIEGKMKLGLINQDVDKLHKKRLFDFYRQF